ncbi:MAG: glycosyltransferase, partial [Chloroflexota bacterium]
GVEVVATPYQGPAIESLWWRAEPNPAKLYGDAFKIARDTLRALLPERPVQMDATSETVDEDSESLTEKITRQTAQTLIAPLWQRHLDTILTDQPDIDAVIFLTIPLNHVVGVPTAIQQKHDIPVLYYDGDVPASLPNMKGFASGFRIYQGADPSEYTAFISNSTGGADYLRELGAKAVHTLWYAADPTLYAPLDLPQDYDAFFFGHGREYRAEWIDAMLIEPSQQLPDMRFAVRGKNLGDTGAVEQLPYLSFSKLREYVCRSKLNLVITRGAHASVYGSSSMRPFELGALGATMVANPYEGIEEWYEPEKEIIVVSSGEEAQDRYRYLLAHDSERLALGKAARERVLKQHTFQHRARELQAIIEQYI